MKKEIANYIGKFLMSGRSLTNSQARIIAYWELVDFQCDIDEPSWERCNVLNKFLEDYSNEMSALV